MAVEIKKRKYCVLKEGREYNSYSMTEEYSNLDDAIKRAEGYVEVVGDKNIIVVEVIAKSKTTRQLVFTGDDEC